MSDTPQRFKTEAECDGDELLAFVQARAADEPPPKFERPEYREEKVAALRAAGLDAEADELEAEQAEGTPLESMTPGQHFARIQGGGY